MSETDSFKHSIKMEYQKITNLLGNLPDKVQSAKYKVPDKVYH